MKLIVALILGLAACTPKGTDTSIATPYTWPGGTFTLTTTSVDDGCADGTFGAGSAAEDDTTPGQWPFPIEIPAWEMMEAGAVVSVQLEPPFTPMDIKLKQGEIEATAVMTGARQQSVVLTSEDDGECTVDMSIDALIALDGPNDIAGFATLTIDDATGEQCPALEDSCTIRLDFTGTTQ
jgi:hypothetical protein